MNYVLWVFVRFALSLVLLCFSFYFTTAFPGRSVKRAANTAEEDTGTPNPPTCSECHRNFSPRRGDKAHANSTCRYCWTTLHGGEAKSDDSDIRYPEGSLPSSLTSSATRPSGNPAKKQKSVLPKGSSPSLWRPLSGRIVPRSGPRTCRATPWDLSVDDQHSAVCTPKAKFHISIPSGSADPIDLDQLEKKVLLPSVSRDGSKPLTEEMHGSPRSGTSH